MKQASIDAYGFDPDRVRVVVLAAGHGSRLKGLYPSFMKPLIPISGKPLIVDILHKAAMIEPNDMTVVVAPQNALQIVESVLHGVAPHVHHVVQPSASGVLDAIRLGIGPTINGNVLVLFADNVISHCPSRETVQSATNFKIALQSIKDSAVYPDLTCFSETELFFRTPGATVDEDRDPDPHAWVGPMILTEDDQAALMRGLAMNQSNDYQLSVENYLNHIYHIDGDKSLNAIKLDIPSFDIGTPERYQTHTGDSA